MEEKKVVKNTAAQGGMKPPPRPMPPRPPRPGAPAPKPVGTVEQNAEPQHSEDIVDEAIKQPENDDKTQDEVAINENKSPALKKEKPKKVKKKREIDKKKLAIILSSVIGGIAFIVGLVFLVLYLLPVSKLNAPRNLEIKGVETSPFVICDEVEGAKKYVFDINGLKFDSSSPYFNLSDFTEPKQYTIKVSAVGEDARSQSDFSQAVNYILKKKLAAPVIHFSQTDSSVIKWASVQNANGYVLKEQNKVTSLGDINELDLDTLGGGIHVVQIYATSNSDNFTSSNLSNELQYECYEKLIGMNARVLENNKIEVTRVENALEYILTINNKQIVVTQFDQATTIVDPTVVLGPNNGTITYLKIEAVGEGYFISNYKEIDLE